MKICTSCNIEKPFTEFSKDACRRDGLQYRCKSCARAYREANRSRLEGYQAAYYAANREHLIEQMSNYRLANKDWLNERQAEYRAANKKKIAECRAAHYAKNKQRILQKSAKNYAANRDRIAKYCEQYYAENRERIAEYQLKYRSANAEKYAQNNRNRRARKRNAEGRHTAADVSRIFEGQRGLCANCHTALFKCGKNKFHVDHIIPLVRGGSNWPDNLQCLCPACNNRKRAKDPIAWANENGRLL